MSEAETLLAVQLEQAGIPFETEVKFHPDRKWRADFMVRPGDPFSSKWSPAILIEIDGGTWSLGRHNRPSSIAKEYEKGAAAAILGYRVIHCTTEQVNDGTCLSWIRQALGQEDLNAA